ncbi:MAG: hypothetical protein VR70_13940 [Rhodospirillaceae bacterium BRH_c57]|nr:MAG: hypothetical protein VR70_13940 [Rhodospirillaceae bacterium BRH_c57]
MRRLAGLIVVATAAIIGAASAQEGPAANGLYRDGLPAVLEQAEKTGFVAAPEFRDAYGRAGAPRMVVFWMRPLGEATSTPRVTRDHTTGVAVVGAASSGATAASVGGFSQTRERSVGLLVDVPPDPLAPSSSRAAEAAFTDALLQSGVRMVDRTAIIRLQGGDAADPRVAETTALKDAADVLVEITASGGGGPDQLIYAIRATRVADGTVLASTVVEEEELRQAMTYEASASGGYHPTLTPRALGRLLAGRLQTLLAARW